MRHKVIRYLALIFALVVTSITVSRLRLSASTSKSGDDNDLLSNKILVEINQRLQGLTMNFTANQPRPASSSNNDANDENTNEYDFAKRYPQLLNCKNEYNKWRPELASTENSSLLNYSIASPSELHNLRITRAVIVYFPIENVANFELELRGLYRSWINMLKYEPTKWRTDLIVFIEKNETYFNDGEFFLNQLNCKFENVRKSPEDKPMCTLLNYVALEKRSLQEPNAADLKKKLENSRASSSSSESLLYPYLLKDVDIFKTDDQMDQLYPFYKAMQTELSRYRYLNSILMAFEG